MSQPNQDWPAWIVAVCATVPVVGLPFAWLARKLSSKVDRTEWEAYLQQRDELADTRHSENLENFRQLFKVSSATGERVARIEGSISGSYRRPT